MELCDSGHEQICFECRGCPLCDMESKLDAANDEIEKLKDKIYDLEREG